jgi:hypothetical protein
MHGRRHVKVKEIHRNDPTPVKNSMATPGIGPGCEQGILSGVVDFDVWLSSLERRCRGLLRNPDYTKFLGIPFCVHWRIAVAL